MKSNPRNKTGKGWKTLTPNKLSTGLPVLSTQIKACNNSSKLDNEISPILQQVDPLSHYNNMRQQNCNDNRI